MVHSPYEERLSELINGTVTVDRADAAPVTGVVSGLDDGGVYIESPSVGGPEMTVTFIAFRDIRGVANTEHDLRQG